MKKLALISLLFINSCTNKVDLRGDWKAIEFMKTYVDENMPNANFNLNQSIKVRDIQGLQDLDGVGGFIEGLLAEQL